MINNSYLLGLFGGSASALGSAGGLGASAVKKKQPTPPWSSDAAAPEAGGLVRAALGGRRFINEGEARLDLKGASEDYRKLFALYQGLETLNALANRAGVKGVSARELTQLNRRFTAGMAEVGAYLSSTALDGVRLVQGAVASTSRATAGVLKDSAAYVTAPVHEGSAAEPVAAFQGAVAFDIQVKTSNGTKTVAIDLSGMGATPRTLDSTLSYINDRLKAEGVQTTLGRRLIPAEPKTVALNGRTITLPAGPDRWALEVRGVSTETIRFSASATTDAVQVVQATKSGDQLLKFDPAASGAARIGEAHWVDGRVAQSALPEGVEAVRASASGPDGSTWMVADISAGPGAQPIKGERDVALLKFDSAGRLVLTQALGAARSASGYALAVSADGKVAVAGSVTGALEPGQSGEAANVADSFVSVFGSDGAELWTQRRGARAEDEATAVSFAADGSVIVAGRARSAMPGAAALGDWDGYVQTIRASQTYPGAPYTVTAGGAAQFGTTGGDSVQATAIDGSNLYTAGVENGRITVRRWQLGPGAPQLLATRDLGEAGGEVSGLAVENGRVVLGGTTRNGALGIGTVNRAHAGGSDAFVAALDASLTPGAADRLTYFGGAGDDTAADLKISGGKVWITGVSDRPAAAKAEDPTLAHLTRLDPLTGAVEWTRTWQGEGGQARTTALSVSSGGASVLDRLGLPQGDIDQSPSKRLVDATAARVGDRFYISPAGGGRRVAVTIEARDTLQSLARKIEQASSMKLKVTISTVAADAKDLGSTGQNALAAALQKLTITPRDGKTGAVITSGESGRDALEALGLSPGYIGASGVGDSVRAFGLDLPADLSLEGKEAVKAAGEALQAAMSAVRSAYRALAPQTPASATGPAPAYYSSQLANYQAALARLGG